jgi:hypothetical protein
MKGQKWRTKAIQRSARQQVRERTESPSRYSMEVGQMKRKIVSQARGAVSKQQVTGGVNVGVIVQAVEAGAPTIDGLIRQNRWSTRCCEKFSSISGDIHG